MESSDDSSHIFGMSIILVLSMSQVARDIMRRSLSERSSLYAGLSETYLRPFPEIGTLTRTRSNEEKKRRRGSFCFCIPRALRQSYNTISLLVNSAAHSSDHWLKLRAATPERWK